MSDRPPADDGLQPPARTSRQSIDALLPEIYDELRVVARRMLANERANHTLQTTALVHEAYVRLIDQRNANPSDRTHFFAVAATVIRRILVDHARQRNAAKRGGSSDRGTSGAESGGAGHSNSETTGDTKIALTHEDPHTGERTIDLIALDDALESLAMLDERASKVVTMRYFAGLTMDQIAEALGVSPRTVADDWTVARRWLRKQLGETADGDGSPAEDRR